MPEDTAPETISWSAPRSFRQCRSTAISAEAAASQKNGSKERTLKRSVIPGDPEWKKSAVLTISKINMIKGYDL